MRNPAKRYTRKQLKIMLAFLIGGLTIAFLLPGHKASASDVIASTIIPTHEHMSIPDHVFRSEYERCSLPSREQLAALTQSKLKNWRKPYFGNRQIEYAGDPNVTITIVLQKDQELVSGGNTPGENENKLKYYGYGDTYVGTNNFYFRCRNSRSGLFNPNVGSICGQNGGVEMLERASHRQWTTAFEDGGGIPEAAYLYKKLAPLPSFYIPADGVLEIVNRQGHTKTTLSGYLTKVVKARKSYFRPWVVVNAFC